MDFGSACHHPDCRTVDVILCEACGQSYCERHAHHPDHGLLVRGVDDILILERDAGDPAVWSYGLADPDGRLPPDPYRLRHSPATGSTPLGAEHRQLWPTVITLVRQAGSRDRIVYSLKPFPHSY